MTTLAVYKPRNAIWACGSKLTESDDEDAVTNGLGTGVSWICDENLLARMDANGKNNALRQVLLSAIAIEEQIMRSKGFRPGCYHGHWM